MRINKPLEQILDNKNKVTLLRHLILYPSDVATGRSLARALGMNQATCNNALNDLHRVGIVTRKQAGRASIYEIARDTVIYEELLKPLFENETRIPAEAVRMLVSGLKAKRISAYLFGSTARGTDTPESDTDIILVIDDKTDREKVLDILSENSPVAYKCFHTGFNITLLSEAELKKRIKRKDDFITTAMAEAIKIKVTP